MKWTNKFVVLTLLFHIVISVSFNTVAYLICKAHPSFFNEYKYTEYLLASVINTLLVFFVVIFCNKTKYPKLSIFIFSTIFLIYSAFQINNLTYQDFAIHLIFGMSKITYLTYSIIEYYKIVKHDMFLSIMPYIIFILYQFIIYKLALKLKITLS